VAKPPSTEVRNSAFTRHYRERAKREVGREVPLAAGGSSHERGAGLAADTVTPSGEALAQEQAQALARAMVLASRQVGKSQSKPRR
jgi:hypothetical protein